MQYLFELCTLERTALGTRSVTDKKYSDKHHIFARTAGARCTIVPKLYMVIELVVPILKSVIHFFDLTRTFSAMGQNVDFWLLSKNNTGRLLLRGTCCKHTNTMFSHLQPARVVRSSPNFAC